MKIKAKKSKIKARLSEMEVFSNQEASDKIGISRVHFSNVINGKANPIKVSKKIANFLGGDVQDYFEISFDD